MPKKKQSRKTGRISSKLIISLVAVAVVLFAVSGGLYWYKQVYQAPEQVFWGMLDNNLSTSSVTRHITQTPEQTGGSSVDQYTRLQMGSQNATKSAVTLSQGDGSSQSIVKSESIGTQSNDYSRYLSVQTEQKGSNGQPLDFSSILGIWGKTDDAEAGAAPQVSYYRQAYLGSVVPFAQLPAQARGDVVQNLRDSNVYEVDYSNVRHEQREGQSVLSFPVKISPKSYVEQLVKILGYTGLDASGLDPSVYANARQIEATFYINPVSRQLVSVVYSGGQEETYSSYGLILPIDLPKDTIPFSELQQRIQSIQQ